MTSFLRPWTNVEPKTGNYFSHGLHNAAEPQPERIGHKEAQKSQKLKSDQGWRGLESLTASKPQINARLTQISETDPSTALNREWTLINANI
jgi:hypothetical protein